MITEDELSKEIIGSAIEVHRQLGPGLLESVYEQCLEYELLSRNLAVERQKPIPLIYKGVTLGSELKIDLLVGGLVVVELKSVDMLLPIHDAQVITYLRLTGCKLGLLLNFNVPMLKKGIRRLVWKL